MRKVLVVSLVAVALALGLLVSRGTTAPNPTDKPVRYEYAELSFSHVGVPPGSSPSAGRVVRWATADEEVKGEDWEGMASVLKAPAADKPVRSTTAQKLRVFNKLSADGWELMDRLLAEEQRFPGAVWNFRRRVP